MIQSDRELPTLGKAPKQGVLNTLIHQTSLQAIEEFNTFLELQTVEIVMETNVPGRNPTMLRKSPTTKTIN